MSAQPNEKLSTADMVSARQPAPQQPPPDERPDMPGNVRRMSRPAGPRGDEAGPGRPAPLVADHEASDLRHRWETIQIGFVDEPRRAVEDADSLVAQAMKRVAEVFADERARLERQWTEGQDVSTEDLRIALTRYRSFFDRLLSV
jgi:hypothetical protein